MVEKSSFVTANSDGSVTLTLTKGYLRDGVQMKVVTLREPTVGDQLAATASTRSAPEQEIALFANLASCTPDEIRGMTMKDYRRLQVAYSDFLD